MKKDHTGTNWKKKKKWITTKRTKKNMKKKKNEEEEETERQDTQTPSRFVQKNHPENLILGDKHDGTQLGENWQAVLNR